MKNKLPEKLVNLEEYAPLEDKYRYKLDANESYIELPKDIEDKVLNVVSDTPLNRYPDPLATELCRAFAKYIGVSPEKVVAGNGSDELISVIENAFLEKGAVIAATKPDFSMYSFYANLNEVKCAFYEKGEDLKIDVDEFIKLINSSGAAMAIFSNPCNPTGQYIDVCDVEKILKSVDALVVVDEAYMEFCGKSALSLIDSYKNLIILKTASKALGLAALRLGFAISNAETAAFIRRAKSPFNVNMVSQRAGAIVLSKIDFIKNSVSAIIESRDYLNCRLSGIAEKYADITVYKTATNFSLIRTKRARELFLKLLDKGIAVRLVGNEFLRVTASSREDNEIFIKTFDALLGGAK